MNDKYLRRLGGNGRLPVSIGHKARNLRILADCGFTIPPTWVIPWEVYARYQSGDVSVLDGLRGAFSQALLLEQAYAVRSSANVEDGQKHSFAGQFKTILQVQGLDALMQAVQEVWDSAGQTSIKAYKRQIDSHQGVKMAVIIQEMVRPVVSGVGFSKNPVSGMDEIVVEAVRGSGEALMQGGATPAHWVYKWGEWVTLPTEEDLPNEIILQAVRLVEGIAQKIRRDVDVEWVYDGERIYPVQMRDITANAQDTVYSNAMAKDMLPGMIKPLIWSVNIPTVTSAWGRFLTQLLGEHGIDPQQLVKQFYYRTYFNMSLLGSAFNQLGFPSEALEMMAGVGGKRGSRMPAMRMHRRLMLKTPRLLRLGWYLFNFHNHLEKALPGLEQESNQFDWQQAGELNEQDLLVTIAKLKELTARTAYFNIVGPILMHAHMAYLRGQLSKCGIDPESFDVMEGAETIEQLDPGKHLRDLHAHFVSLPLVVQDCIRATDYAGFLRISGCEPFQAAVAGFLERFGHLSDSGNDFSSIPWREAPDLILQVIVNYPEVRSRVPDDHSVEQPGMHSVQRWFLRQVVARVRRYRLCRDRISFRYTYIYGMFRPYYLALGEHLVRRGLLDTAEEILYLYEDEVLAAVRAVANDGDNLRATVSQRQQEMEQLRPVLLPGIIYGEEPPPVTGVSADKLTGTATSRGIYTGPVKVVSSMQDFDKVNPGDVLVVPFSDVGWTPLFAKAGGVVAESGGMLSHSSIIAREFHIPAVVSVNGATRLHDCTIVTIDGYKGEVLIHDRTDALDNIG